MPAWFLIMTPLFRTLAFTTILTLLLAGCAQTPDSRGPDRRQTASLSPATWELVDKQLWTASREAREEARIYAEDLVDGWIRRVHDRTEAEFLPWYTGYWTQQWLAIKVGLYGLDQSESGETPAQRLAAYLQQQFSERVLEPVARDIEPRRAAERTTERYLQAMRASARYIEREQRLPPNALQARLGRVTAISLYGNPPRQTSLAKLIATQDPMDVPVYRALLEQSRPPGGETAFGSDRIYPMARREADALAGNLALRGGASVAALGVGGVAGILISVGISGLQAMANQLGQPEIERELRSNLDSALADLRLKLLNAPGGVIAAVDHIGSRVEADLGGTWAGTRHGYTGKPGTDSFAPSLQNDGRSLERRSEGRSDW